MLIGPLLIAVCVPLHVDIEFESNRALTPVTKSAIVGEAARIWSPYGVLVRENHTPTSLSVIIAGESNRARGSSGWASPLGEASFSQTGAPSPVVSLFYDAAVQLMGAATLPDAAGWRWTIPHQHDLLGRVLGRALAHEIGHYLLRSREHSALGLMRAQHPIADLLGEDGRRFELMPDQAARLRQGAAGEATDSVPCP
jgi:hypothetical protein